MKWQDLAGPQRLMDMQSAIELLIRWQQTTYQLPLLENPGAFYSEKERIAALLVDNHLGKLARKVRMLGEDGGLDSESFLNDWAEIAFFTSLWSRFDKLRDDLKLNLLYHSGPNITKKHLTNIKPVDEELIVVGLDFSPEERLLRRSVYFYGMSQKNYYHLLEYSFNKRPFDQHFQIGETYQASMVRYPLDGDIRIRGGKWNKISGAGLVNQIEPAKARMIASAFHDSLKINPFCEPFPAFIMLSSDYKNGKWRVIDPEGCTIHMKTMKEQVAAKFYAASFRNLTPVFVLCSREGILPLSYYNGDYIVTIDDTKDGL